MTRFGYTSISGRLHLPSGLSEEASTCGSRESRKFRKLTP
jgi:hypothetical protein